MEYPIDFSKKSYYLKVLNSKTHHISKKYLKGILSPQLPTTFFPHNAFVDAGGCVQVRSGDLAVSQQYCWSSPTPQHTSPHTVSLAEDL